MRWLGRKDTVTKKYMRNPVVFADVFNKYLYHGRQVIKPENLMELDTTEPAVPYGNDDAGMPRFAGADSPGTEVSGCDENHNDRWEYGILCPRNRERQQYSLCPSREKEISRGNLSANMNLSERWVIGKSRYDKGVCANSDAGRPDL